MRITRHGDHIPLDTGDVVTIPLVEDRSNCPLRPMCPRCERWAWPSRVQGRWDSERSATAIPFEPVHVAMSCGCEFGDATKARAAQ